MAGDYRGLLGAYVSAFRRSGSFVFRSYVVTSAVAGVVTALFLALALVSWLGSGTAFGQQALLGVIGLFVLVPLFAPVLVVASRHRGGVDDPSADALLGLTGYGFLVAVFLALFISDPNPHDLSGLGPLAPAFAAIDALPRAAWPVPLLLSVAVIYLAVRDTRPTDGVGRPSDGPSDDPEG